MHSRDIISDIINNYHVEDLKVVTIQDYKQHPFITFKENVPIKLHFKKINILIDDLDSITEWTTSLSLNKISTLIIVNMLNNNLIEAIIEVDHDVYYIDVTNNIVKFIGTN